MEDMKFPVPSNFLQLSEEDAIKVINCLYTLINQRRTDLNSLEESQISLRKKEAARNRLITDEKELRKKIRETNQLIKTRDQEINMLKLKQKEVKKLCNEKMKEKERNNFKITRLENQYQV